MRFEFQNRSQSKRYAFLIVANPIRDVTMNIDKKLSSKGSLE